MAAGRALVGGHALVGGLIALGCAGAPARVLVIEPLVGVVCRCELAEVPRCECSGEPVDCQGHPAGWDRVVSRSAVGALAAR